MRRDTNMLMMQYVHERMLELVRKSYPEDYERYRHFYIRFEFKEKKSSYSKYIFEKRILQVTTLSREPADILLSLILELAHHIDIIQRKETHDDRTYLLIIRKLLDTALKQNMILPSELYRTGIRGLKDRLQENFGSFQSWRCESRQESEHVYILVFDAYMIKNLLKANRYRYDPDQQAWSKYIKAEEYDDELYFLSQYQNRADFRIIKDNTFYIRPCYCLKIETYSIEDKELWKAFSYHYRPTEKKWYKYIYAADLKIELEMIQDLPNQKITISRIKAARA